MRPRRKGRGRVPSLGGRRRKRATQGAAPERWLPVLVAESENGLRQNGAISFAGLVDPAPCPLQPPATYQFAETAIAGIQLPFPWRAQRSDAVPIRGNGAGLGPPSRDGAATSLAAPPIALHPEPHERGAHARGAEGELE